MLTAREFSLRWKQEFQTQGEDQNFLVLGILFALGKTLRTTWKKSKDLLDIKNSEKCFNDLSANESLTHVD